MFSGVLVFTRHESPRRFRRLSVFTAGGGVLTVNTIRSELAAAFRAVGAEYRRLPEDKRPDIAWAATDDLLEAALGTDDRAKAMSAIREWERHWLGLFEEAAR